MAERSSLTQAIQIGVETVPGTGVVATKRLSALGITPSISVSNKTFRPTGSKFNAISALGKEWTQSAIAGEATYTELIYAFSSIIGNGNVANVANVYTWGFSPNPYSSDVVSTFTVEHGSSVRADKFSYGIFTEFTMTFTRESITLGGSMMGRALADNIVMSNVANVTAVPLVPILSTQVTVYLDNEGGAFGTTKLTRLLSGEWSMGSRFSPLWIIDAANPSFVAHVETAPDAHINLTLEADAQGMGLLQNLRAGDVHLLRIEAIGANIAGGATPFRLTIDQKVEITDTGGFSDAAGVYAVEFSCMATYTGSGTNPTAGTTTSASAIGITLVNNVATL
jgi:hypothetical protein